MDDEPLPYPHLFQPLVLAGRRLGNRIVHAAITTASSRDRRITPRHTQYYANRARGGAAMIVTEPLNMAPHQRAPNKVDAGSDAAIDDLKRWAEAVESHDCRLVAQVQDAGRGRHAPGRNTDAVGASALPDDLSWTMPHALGRDEIGRMLDGFAEGARRLQRCGFSGVEISAGHGHLFHQFLSPWSNTREDGYGGDFEGRMRLLVELAEAIRAACGSGFILGLKSPGDDGIPGSIGPELGAAIARRMEATGTLDYICFAQGTHHRTLDMHAPDRNAAPLTYMALIRTLRAAVPGLPVVALGRITDPAEGEGILARGEAELIGLGRPLVTDPAWPEKARAGRARDIRSCVGGNVCWRTIVQRLPIQCENNPRVAGADELAAPAAAARRKRVVVVGAGVAGLEAAWVAAARGHQVTLFGRSREVGGSLRLQAALPGGEPLSSVYDYQMVEAGKAGVRLELGVEATAADILGLSPDAVVLATGSTMTWPRILPDALRAEGIVPDLRRAIPDLLQLHARQPGAAVLLDMDHTDGTYAAAELLARLFQRVVLITPRDRIAEDTALLTRQGILRRFHRLGIACALLSEPCWNERFEQEGCLEYANVYTGRRDTVADVAFFAYATARAPDRRLQAPLGAAGVTLHLIGDCKVARDCLAATGEGYAVGALL